MGITQSINEFIKNDIVWASKEMHILYQPDIDLRNDKSWVQGVTRNKIMELGIFDGEIENLPLMDGRGERVRIPNPDIRDRRKEALDTGVITTEQLEESFKEHQAEVRERVMKRFVLLCDMFQGAGPEVIEIKKHWEEKLKELQTTEIN